MFMLSHKHQRTLTYAGFTYSVTYRLQLMASRARPGRARRRANAVIQQPDRDGVIKLVSGGGLNGVRVRFESTMVFEMMQGNNFAGLVAATGVPEGTVLTVENYIGDNWAPCQYYCHMDGVLKKVGMLIHFTMTQVNT